MSKLDLFDNKIFPYKVECLNEDEYIYLKGFFSFNKPAVNNAEQKELLKIHNRVFNTTKSPSSCGSCVKGLVNTMQTLFNEYEQEAQAKKTNRK